jgi:hypothetical protein
MENVFSHELVGVIKQACFAHHGNAIRPVLLLVGEQYHDPLLVATMDELRCDSTLSLLTVKPDDQVFLQRALLSATVVFVVSEVAPQTLQLLMASKKPLLEWSRVKRDACPLFSPAHSVMDFFIVHQDSLVESPTHSSFGEGKEQ